MIGKIISHSRILEKIGEGGMGVVDRAEDTKLRRHVALKFIRPEASSNADLRARFFKETEAAAALDHSNIATIHEIDEVDGQTFLAMALVEGGSLSDEIRSGPLPIDEALSIASQTASALQVLILPVFVLILLRLTNDRKLLGEYVNGWVSNAAMGFAILAALYLTYGTPPRFGLT